MQIQLKSLAEEQQAIVKGLEKVELELTASESDGPVSEIFCKVYAPGKNADSLAMYFGEDPARYPFEQVCLFSILKLGHTLSLHISTNNFYFLCQNFAVISTLLNFVRILRKAHEENGKQAELEKKKAQKEAEAEKSKEANIAKNVSR
ncbi:hypothetical protein BHE74_00051857 [Ensete ventricosum]|nr:hypothetical protein GW17_00036055 [Ensete ventricosum]RWW42583.1 hypothetical protein BHE74_00051857 [Ensete ventricosum]RZS24651.1 hypothetical protein BHM03_00057746 [Ensete ventricosum]